MDFNIVRSNMVEQQIRPFGVLNSRVLDLLSTLPREYFIPPQYQSFAFCDTFIPLAHNQVMLPPKIVGRALEALALDHKEKVLEIGTGTGYVTALLATLSKKIFSIEIFPDLSREAQKNLNNLQLQNVTLEIGDAAESWSYHAPYDAIFLTGSTPYLPKIFREHLNINGRIFAVIGEPPVMSAVLLTRVAKAHWTEQILFETEIPKLINAPRINSFQF